MFFFFNDTATTEIYTLSLHDALPICTVLDRREKTLPLHAAERFDARPLEHCCRDIHGRGQRVGAWAPARSLRVDRKSTRLNSSHSQISYAVFCLKYKNRHTERTISPI